MYASASMARLKAARRLTKRALRQRERAFLAEGPQAVSEALATGAHVTGLFVTAPAQVRHADLVGKAEDAGVDVQLVSGEVMSELAQTVTPQGLLAVCDFVDIPLDQVTASFAMIPGGAAGIIGMSRGLGADGEERDVVVIVGPRRPQERKAAGLAHADHRQGSGTVTY